MTDRTELIRHLRILVHNLEHTETSWALFVKSACDFEIQQKERIELVNQTDIGGMVDHIQIVLLYDCIAALCRLMDVHSSRWPDRISLDSTIDRARSFTSSVDATKLDALNGRVKTLRDSPGMTSLREYRNQYVSHTLNRQDLSTQYKWIPVTTETASEILGELLELCEVTRWIGQATKHGQEHRAKLFWRMLDQGAEASKAPQRRKEFGSE